MASPARLLAHQNCYSYRRPCINSLPPLSRSNPREARACLHDKYVLAMNRVPRQAVVDDDPSNDYHYWPWLILFALLLVLLGGLVWIIFATLHARRLGLPQPSLNPFSDRNRISSRNYPNSGGVTGWLKTKFRGLRNFRTHGGAYEGGRAGRRGFGRLDPDEAWDARVDNEADASGYYEEQELGLHDDSGAGYRSGAHGYGPSGGLDEIVNTEHRGRNAPNAELDNRYDEAMGGSSRNPFGDQAEASSLRGISPRPHEDSPRKDHASQVTGDGPRDQRSMFMEDV